MSAPTAASSRKMEISDHTTFEAVGVLPTSGSWGQLFVYE
jgi:hypothetical protein